MTASQLVGVALAIVTANNDPDNRGRVKVSLPWHDEPNVSIWARLVLSLHSLIQETPEIPNIGDEVLVAFDHGGIQFPYVIGKPWNGISASAPATSESSRSQRALAARSQ